MSIHTECQKHVQNRGTASTYMHLPYSTTVDVVKVHMASREINFVPAIVCSHTMKNTAEKVCQRAL